ncbi:MAG: hypothetical protein Tsb0020_29360 [Haliangiales bacterium]
MNDEMRSPDAPRRFYDYPLYYEVAFAGGTALECERVLTLLARHGLAEPGDVLEAACGGGRFLLALAEHGWRASGYDAHPAMVAFAAGRAFASPSGDSVAVWRADMRAPLAGGGFDAALCLNNSLGYLHGDDELSAHLRATAGCLKPGGLYVIQLGCAWDKLDPEDEARWQARWGRVETDVSWRVVREDHAAKRSHEQCRVRVRDGARELVIDEPHCLRLWFDADLRALAATAGFVVEAVYSADLAQLAPATRLSGELGNLYFVLRAGAR